MGMKEMIATQYDYNCWANARILENARHLSDEQYYAEAVFRSVHELLVHTVRTEWVWRTLAQYGEITEPPPGSEDIRSLGDVRALWRQEETAFRSYLEELSDVELAGKVETVSPAGQAHTLARWEMLQHMLLHSMQHRAELASVLTSYEHSPGDLDFIFFVIGRE